MQWKSLSAHISFFWLLVKNCYRKLSWSTGTAICSDIPEKLSGEIGNKYGRRTRRFLGKKINQCKQWLGPCSTRKSPETQVPTLTPEWDSDRMADITTSWNYRMGKRARESGCRVLCDASPWVAIRAHHSHCWANSRRSSGLEPRMEAQLLVGCGIQTSSTRGHLSRKHLTVSAFLFS